MSDFHATPKMSEFMNSRHYIRVLAGPIGGGKSVCCSHELFKWACEQAPNSSGVRKTRFLIVRNTADQLRSTTMKTVLDWFPPGIAGEYKSGEKTLYLKFKLGDGTEVYSEWLFIPLDTPDDVRKALSLEATGLWGNEARELHPEVIDGLLMRVDRYPSMKDGGATRAGAIFDTNMPDEEGWWFDKMETPPDTWSIHIQPPAVLTTDEYIAQEGSEPEEVPYGVGHDGLSYYVNPQADNLNNLSKVYYPNNITGKTIDFINVYLRCKYGRSKNGMPVYDKSFIPSYHISYEQLSPIRSASYPIIIGLDFGRTPAAIFGQINVRGQLIILSEVTAKNMGIEKFVAEKLRPHIAEHYMGCALLVAPDPAGYAKTQLNETTPVDILRMAGYKTAKPATNSIAPRIQAVENWLVRQIDGKPAVLIASGCTTLLKGFRFGYKFKTDKEDQLRSETPDKNDYSHIHDAMQYLCLIANGNGSGQMQSMRREIQKAPHRWAV